ncbi:hypothetical protein ACIBG5_13730 [Kribbella sp. NPDC050241]|uniref:hypothetical protein n=1 Tax=Kribbella sp. NPDC050241 TaxID=3364115 RepID=UPI0037B37878
MGSRRFVRRLVVGALVLMVTAGAVPSAVAAGNDHGGSTGVMRVVGAGGGTLGPEWGLDFAGDPVRFEIDGRATDPLHPSGTFHVVHRKPDGKLLAEFSGPITSLKAVDEVAVVTGVIDAADNPGLPLEMVGKNVSLTVYDGGRQDRISWIWGFFGAPVSLLQGTAPTFPLTEGGFQVHGARQAQAAGGTTVAQAADSGTTVAALLGDSTLRFQLAARVPAGGNPTEVQGDFHFADRRGSGVDVEGRIDCLVAGGPVAVATGVVTASNDPAKVGKPVSFSLKDGRIDRLGWIWGFAADAPQIVDCQSVVPSYAPRWGGLSVR